MRGIQWLKQKCTRRKKYRIGQPTGVDGEFVISVVSIVAILAITLIAIFLH